MPLGLGLAVSNSPVLFRPRDQWEALYRKLIGTVPQPTKAGEETPEVLDQYAARVEAGFAALRRALESYKPDAVIVVSSDKGQVFSDTHVPQLSVLIGKELWGTPTYRELGEERREKDRVTIPVHSDLALWLVDEVTEEGFDMNVNRVFKPLGDPEGGANASLINVVQRVMPRLDVPIIPLFVNAHKDPCITGHRMSPLGNAIARVMSERGERVAILAVGGLSGDPMGYLAGWVDELLDHWVLTRLRRGRSAQLGTLWDMDSTTTRGATREVRNWIVAGGAMEATGAKAVILDYIRFHHATVGTAFATWEAGKAPPLVGTALATGTAAAAPAGARSM